MTDGVPGNDYLDTINQLLPELKTTQRGKLKSDRFPELKNVIYIGHEKHRGMYNTAEMLLLGQNKSDEELNAVKSTINCHDVVNMQYTSGTTGFPKGVMLSHHNIANNVVLAVMNCLTHGSTQVMVERFDPLVTLASIHKERCTAVYGVPTMFIAELNHPMFNLFDMSSLRTGIMAGALCPIELMRQVNEKMFMTITSVYGLTETSPGMTQTRIEDSFEIRCTTVGHDYEFTEVAIIDPVTGEHLPDGVQGEVCCRGYNVMKGYYKNPEATAQVIDKDGYLHSGDLGVRDPDGNYRITGRIKDMIIRGGENISPREIEEFLYHMPGVKDAQVIAVTSPRYGEDVGVFIIPHDGAEITAEDVRDFCKDKIARYKIPRYIFFVNEYPLTGSGKIQKFKLREMAIELCQKEGIQIV
jgi:fatty-acyl-CoA synthase